MNFAINPINRNTINVSGQFSLYKEAQDSAQRMSKIVFQSIAILTNSVETGISAKSLQELKDFVEDNDLTENGVYELLNTLLGKFGALSSDGKVITEADFLGAIKFSVAQDYKENTDLYGLVRSQSQNFGQDVIAAFGKANLETLDLMLIMDSLSDETINKIIANLNSKTEPSLTDEVAPKIEVSKNTAMTNPYEPQDYKTVSPAQLKSPISLTV